MYWTIVLGSFFSFLLLATAPAFATTFAGNEEVCKALVYATEDANDLKSSGVSWDEVFAPWLRQQLNEAKGNPRSYIKDDSDVQFVMDSFKRVYENPAPATQHQVYESCMKTSGVKPGVQLLKGRKHKAIEDDGFIQVKFAKKVKSSKPPKTT